MHFPRPKLESFAKTHNKCKSISKFGAYPEIGCENNLQHCPQATQSSHTYPHAQTTMKAMRSMRYENHKQNKHYKGVDPWLNAYLSREHQSMLVLQLEKSISHEE